MLFPTLNQQRARVACIQRIEKCTMIAIDGYDKDKALKRNCAAKCQYDLPPLGELERERRIAEKLLFAAASRYSRGMQSYASCAITKNLLHDPARVEQFAETIRRLIEWRIDSNCSAYVTVQGREVRLLIKIKGSPKARSVDNWCDRSHVLIPL